MSERVRRKSLRALASDAGFTIYPSKSPIGLQGNKIPADRIAEWAPGPTFYLCCRLSSQDRTGLPIDTNQIAEIIEPSLDAMGYRLVRVAVMGAGRMTLQIMAERRDEAAMSVDDCAEISRTVSALLDVADPIAGAYTLEVSSPGIDRPLVRLEDYDRFAGFEAKIELSQPVAGRKRFRGRLLGSAGENVRLISESGEVQLPFPVIARAKLVLTDDLLAHAQSKSGLIVPTH
jgi:ribosome maturation factor RimP